MTKKNTKPTEPELPAGLSEQRLTLPWMIIRRGGTDDTLLVSSPDGVVLEFAIPKTAVDGFSLMLADSRLWNTFFSSLLNSFKITPGGKND